MKTYTKRLTALFVVLACMLVCFVGCSTDPAEDSTEVEPIVRSEAFDAVFEDSAISWTDTAFAGMESKAFVLESESGMIECFEFGYEDDVICSYVDTVYLDISGYSEEEKTSLDQTMQATFASVGVLDFANISYDMGDTHYTIVVSVDGLDDAETLQDAIASGIFAMESSGEGPTAYLSMLETESGLLAQGYIQR